MINKDLIESYVRKAAETMDPHQFNLLEDIVTEYDRAIKDVKKSRDYLKGYYNREIQALRNHIAKIGIRHDR